MRECPVRIGRMVAVELEYRAATRAVGLLMNHLEDDPNYLEPDKLRYRDAVRLNSNLEATYLIRLFAEFEAGLRDYWRHGLVRDTKPPMADLVSAIGTSRSVPQDVIEAAHQVRETRNSLVHEGGEGGAALPLSESKSRLCKYFCRLPSGW
jgi:hypothetical protein